MPFQLRCTTSGASPLNSYAAQILDTATFWKRWGEATALDGYLAIWLRNSGCEKASRK